MNHKPLLADSTTIPKAADSTAAEIGLERWAELAASIGNPALEAEAAQLSADLTVRRLHAAIEDVMAALRTAKRRAALAIAIADILERWPLERITGALSDLAGRTLRVALRHQLCQAHAKGWLGIAHDEEPEKGCGYFVLGLGKLGAQELNYSSDIDLVVLYDEDRVRTGDREALNQNFVRMTRNLVRKMQERTPEGYVFRTDLRLRPDPAATPLALSTTAAELYYESLGQNWERAAFIKARPVAGDLEAGEAFLRRLQPFLWRRHLDFAAIRDIHSI